MDAWWVMSIERTSDISAAVTQHNWQEILEFLRSEDCSATSRNRVPTVRALVAFGHHSEVHDALLGVVGHDESDAVRLALVDKIAKSEAGCCVDILLKAVESFQIINVRKPAVIALGAASDSESLAALKELLHDPEPTIRISAAKAIGQRGDLGSERDLQNLLNDETRLVRLAAATALADIGALDARDDIAALARRERWPFNRVAKAAIAQLDGRRRK